MTQSEALKRIGIMCTISMTTVAKASSECHLYTGGLQGAARFLQKNKENN